MSLDEWEMPDPAETPIAPPAEAVLRLTGYQLDVTIEDDGYGRQAAVIRFDNGRVIVVGSQGGHSSHIQIYGDPDDVDVDELRSGRTNLGQRQTYISVDTK